MISSGTFLVVCQLPHPLSSGTDTILLTAKSDSAEAHLIIRRDGSLALSIEPHGSAKHIHEFQRIHVTGSAKVIIDLDWGDSTTSLRITGKEVLPQAPPQLPLL